MGLGAAGGIASYGGDVFGTLGDAVVADAGNQRHGSDKWAKPIVE